MDARQVWHFCMSGGDRCNRFPGHYSRLFSGYCRPLTLPSLLPSLPTPLPSRSPLFVPYFLFSVRPTAVCGENIVYLKIDDDDTKHNVAARTHSSLTPHFALVGHAGSSSTRPPDLPAQMEWKEESIEVKGPYDRVVSVQSFVPSSPFSS